MVYTATDSSGNKGTATRYVTVQNRIPPNITLTPPLSFTLDYGSEFVESGATATDIVDGDISGQIYIQNLVYLKVGNQVQGHVVYLTYSVTDSAGLTSTAQRNVTISGTASVATTAAATSIGVGAGVGAVAILILLIFIIRRRIQTRRRQAPAAPEAVGKAISFENPFMQDARTFWFHGEISRQVAEERIAAKGIYNGTFLIRNKNDKPDEMVISYVFSARIFHNILIKDSNGQFITRGFEASPLGKSFEDVVNSLKATIVKPFPCPMTIPVAPPQTSKLSLNLPVKPHHSTNAAEPEQADYAIATNSAMEAATEAMIKAEAPKIAMAAMTNAAIDQNYALATDANTAFDLSKSKKLSRNTASEDYAAPANPDEEPDFSFMTSVKPTLHAASGKDYPLAEKPSTPSRASSLKGGDDTMTLRDGTAPHRTSNPTQAARPPASTAAPNRTASMTSTTGANMLREPATATLTMPKSTPSLSEALTPAAPAPPLALAPKPLLVPKIAAEVATKRPPPPPPAEDDEDDEFDFSSVPKGNTAKKSVADFTPATDFTPAKLNDLSSFPGETMIPTQTGEYAFSMLATSLTASTGYLSIEK